MRAPLDGAVLVARPSRWGNPVRVGDGISAAEAVWRYEHEYLPARSDLLAQLSELRGRRLACYCALNEPCHADVLARWANVESASDDGGQR
jgi:hypothetical protein